MLQCYLEIFFAEWLQFDAVSFLRTYTLVGYLVPSPSKTNAAARVVQVFVGVSSQSSSTVLLIIMLDMRCWEDLGDGKWQLPLNPKLVAQLVGVLYRVPCFNPGFFD